MLGVALGEYGTLSGSDEGTAGGWWAWIVDRLEAFDALGPTIYDAGHRATIVAAKAKAAGDLDTYEDARDAVKRIMELWSYQQSLAPRARRIGERVRGLGVFPWIVAGLTAAGVVSLGIGMAFVFARFGAERRIVELLERGELSPGEAERLLAETEGGAGFGAIGSVTQLVLLALIGFGVWTLSRGRG